MNWQRIVLNNEISVLLKLQSHIINLYCLYITIILLNNKFDVETWTIENKNHKYKELKLSKRSVRFYISKTINIFKTS